MAQAEQKMFIESLQRRYPRRVLQHIQVDYSGFRALFDLPRKRRLEIALSVYAQEGNTLEVYEHVKGSEPYRYWLIKSYRYEMSGTDPLPCLSSYLKTVIGGSEQSYEGSFVEVMCAAFRGEKAGGDSA